MKRREVGEGADVGWMIGERPVGIMPKSWGSGWAAIEDGVFGVAARRRGLERGGYRDSFSYKEMLH